MSKYKHKVMVEVPALMADDGEILIEERYVQANLDNLEPPKEWCDDDRLYLLHSDQLSEPVVTTCGVIRKLRKQ